MAVNKVVMNTENGEKTLIDLTSDTVTPETLAEGVTAHNASGEEITGSFPLEAVRYTAQTLTATQKAQARANIDAIGESDLQNAVNDALDQAKTSGEFNGNDGVSIIGATLTRIG